MKIVYTRSNTTLKTIKNQTFKSSISQQAVEKDTKNCKLTQENTIIITQKELLLKKGTNPDWYQELMLK